jgi:ubiquitin-like modifier-activating enzyme ATG7
MPQKLQYSNLSYIIDTTTWHEIEKLKINEWKLDQSEIEINSYITNPTNLKNTKMFHLANMITISPNSFNTNYKNDYNKNLPLLVKFQNFNIEQDLINLNIKEYIEQQTTQFLSVDMLTEDNYKYLLHGVLFTYSDLKHHLFKFIMDFPVLTFESSYVYSEKYDSIEDIINISFDQFVNQNNINSLYPIVINKQDKSVKPLTREVVMQLNSNMVVCMYTLSPHNMLGLNWKNLINYMRIVNPNLINFNILAMCESWEKSLYFKCTCDPLTNGQLKTIKLSSLLKPTITTIDLSKSMNPHKIAESASKLNLNLMKWRMLPDLELDDLSNSKVLLLGSGTLGCNIARNLLMWGVTNITLVDRGTVSYSNPVRQSLFEFKDCFQKNNNESIHNLKCNVAVNALKRILPTANCVGVNLTIPMPGHRIDDQNMDQTVQDIKQLEQLILDHDVTYLLTDNRESRWLPTLLCSVHQKPVINVALGIESFVVMRHGLQGQGENRLGCYFCNDIVAPEDSISNRSIDQQCTITRPGLSPIASAIAVEILASIYNHPLKFLAPAYDENNTDAENEKCQTVVSVIPQQIRGEMRCYSNTIMNGCQFDKCVACSDIMKKCFEQDKYDFIIRCINEHGFIQKTCGLDNIGTCEMIEFDFDE